MDQTVSNFEMRARAHSSLAFKVERISDAVSQSTLIHAFAVTKCGARVPQAACTRRNSLFRIRYSAREGCRSLPPSRQSIMLFGGTAICYVSYWMEQR